MRFMPPEHFLNTLQGAIGEKMKKIVEKCAWVL